MRNAAGTLTPPMNRRRAVSRPLVLDTSPRTVTIATTPPPSRDSKTMNNTINRRTTTTWGARMTTCPAAFVWPASAGAAAAARSRGSEPYWDRS